MLQVLQQEKEQGLSDRVYVRCALQILMCRHLGFAGVHLSACHQPEEQSLLECYIEEYRHLSFAECERLWNTLWQVQTGTEFIQSWLIIALRLQVRLLSTNICI